MTAAQGAKPLRGEIWEFDLKGRRPCIVVSTDALNRSQFGTVIICPIATTERRTLRWRVGIIPLDLRIADATWRAKRHWIATDQVVTVDTAARAVRHLATIVNEVKLRQIDDSLRTLLDLTCP